MAEALRNEVMFMKMIEHPNIVKIYEVLSSRSKVFFVL